MSYIVFSYGHLFRYLKTLSYVGATLALLLLEFASCTSFCSLVVRGFYLYISRMMSSLFALQSA